MATECVTLVPLVTLVTLPQESRMRTNPLYKKMGSQASQSVTNPILVPALADSGDGAPLVALFGRQGAQR